MNLRTTPTWVGLRDDVATMHRAVLAAADPAAAVTRVLRVEGRQLHVADEAIPLSETSRLWLVALGKAAPAMARAALDVLANVDVGRSAHHAEGGVLAGGNGGVLAGGVVAYPRDLDPGGEWPAAALRRFPAGHPLPDEGSLQAGEAALEMLQAAAEQDVVLVLVSGGGSALFEALRPGVTLADVQQVTRALQHSGADILQLNVVRRALSGVKGGGLARAAGPARVVTLLLSDVVGDRIEAIASGPTVESSTGPREALEILAARGLSAHCPAVVRALEEAAAVPPGPMPTSRVLAVVGSNRGALDAAGAAAEALGFRTLVLTDRLQGEARDIGRLLGRMARGMRESGLPFPPPACLVLGGETTVTVRGPGRGGRNLELALAAAAAIDGCEHTAVFAFATDGTDGSSNAAGAIVTGDTLERARGLGLSADQALDANDSAGFFEALGDLWITGPTGTNVNDVVLLLAYP